MVALLAATSARAEDFPVEIVAALAPVKKEDGAAGVVFVGRSGQLYVPAGAGAWKRRDAGGVAIDVAAAVRRPGAPAEVLAAGATTPAFRFAGGTWRAEPLPNRGAVALSRQSPLVALAIGRSVYTWEKDRFVRRAAGPKKPTAVWAAAPAQILVAGADGTLARWNGKSLTPVRTPLVKTDVVSTLLGASPAQVYGRADSGAWIRIDRVGTAAMSFAGELTGFEVHAYGLGPDGALVLAGTLPASGGRRALLARADKNRLLAWDDLGALPEGERFAVVHGHPASRELVVALSSGGVRVRAADGTWREGRVSGRLPSRPASSASAAPARAR